MEAARRQHRKDRSRSLTQVNDSSEYDGEAAGLSDEQLRKAAGLLNLEDLAESEDIPQFLAIAREAAERASGLRPFDVQLLGALRMLAGDVIEMATGEARPWPARSPPPGTRSPGGTCTW